MASGKAQGRAVASSGRPRARGFPSPSSALNTSSTPRVRGCDPAARCRSRRASTARRRRFSQPAIAPPPPPPPPHPRVVAATSCSSCSGDRLDGGAGERRRRAVDVPGDGHAPQVSCLTAAPGLCSRPTRAGGPGARSRSPARCDRAARAPPRAGGALHTFHRPHARWPSPGVRRSPGARRRRAAAARATPWPACRTGRCSTKGRVELGVRVVEVSVEVRWPPVASHHIAASTVALCAQTSTGT